MPPHPPRGEIGAGGPGSDDDDDSRVCVWEGGGGESLGDGERASLRCVEIPAKKASMDRGDA